MADSDDTSASAASSDAKPSSRGSSGAEPALRVDFYILDEASATARLKLACRLAEKAYLAQQSALVWHTDPHELQAFDEMLWTFMEGSFVPHDLLSPNASANEAPVMLSAGTPPTASFDVVINLSPEIPPCLSQAQRIAEIVDGDDSRRRAGRTRFKAYRELGVQPASHNIRADQVPG